jgi:ribonuclease PH
VSFVYGKQLVDFIELREAKVNSDTLKKLVDIAVQGCNTLYRRMKQALIENAFRQVLIK